MHDTSPYHALIHKGIEMKTPMQDLISLAIPEYSRHPWRSRCAPPSAFTFRGSSPGQALQTQSRIDVRDPVSLHRKVRRERRWIPAFAGVTTVEPDQRCPEGSRFAGPWRRLACNLLVSCCCALLPLAAMAHEHMDMPQQAALGAGAAFDAHGRLWLATVRDGHVQVRHSDDLGKSFSQPVVVNPVAETIYAAGENRPKIAAGPDGTIYVQWTEQPAPGWTGYIRLARSTDGGEHFSAPVTVNHDGSKVTRGFDSLAIAGNGDVVSAWIDARDADKAKKAGKPYGGFAIYYAWSDDGGRHFTPGRKLMDHSCECCRTTLARTPDGAVAAFFRGVYGDNIRDHAFAVLHTDGQPDDPERATFSGWQVPACPDQGPGLAIGADGVRHAVWYEASNGPAVWYGQLDPGHPPRHRLKLGGPGASHADVAVHGETVWVVWNQVDAKGYELMLRTSHDDGAHFEAARTAATSTAAVASPQLLLHAGHAYAAWNTADGFRLVPLGEH